MSRYHEGIYGPVDQELTAFDLKVEGAIPPELQGRYLRNGPNPSVPAQQSQHWFSGDGMVHGVELAEGRATWYRTRYVRTAALAERTGLEAAPGAERSAGSPSNTNVIFHAGRTLALCEPDSLPFELSRELESIGPHDFGGALTRGFTAHPKIDPASGELHVCGYDPVSQPHLTYYCIDQKGQSVRSVPIELPLGTMAHDFAITERHVLFLDLPVRFDLEAAAAGDSFPLRFQPETGARVGVMPRAGDAGDIVWFEVEPCYVFHPLNAFDAGDRVSIDVVRYARLHATGDPAAGPLDEGPTTLDRWSFDLASGRTEETRLREQAIEFPRIDDRLVGSRHRYGYATELASRDGLAHDPAGLLKFDLERGSTERHDFGPGWAAGEPVFVPGSRSAGEDEGWLLAIVHNPERDAGDLVILDATDVSGRAIAHVQLPQRVPSGFHGNWMPDPGVD